MIGSCLDIRRITGQRGHYAHFVEPHTWPGSAEMKFCSHCGSPRLALRIPDGDNLPRFVCADCGTIHYQNPKIVVGCLPEWQGRVLLCKRAIEPRYGLWTLPAGFLENGETIVGRRDARDARGGERARRARATSTR